jgi:hypothetical protein
MISLSTELFSQKNSLILPKDICDIKIKVKQTEYFFNQTNIRLIKVREYKIWAEIKSDLVNSHKNASQLE